MARRIIMAVTNDLLTDQRVDRSCRALQEAGYEVTLVGRKLPTSEALEARNYRCVRMRLMFRRSAAFYAEYNLRLLIRLLVMPADAFDVGGTVHNDLTKYFAWNMSILDTITHTIDTTIPSPGRGGRERKSG